LEYNHHKQKGFEEELVILEEIIIWDGEKWNPSV
jgi:hypothetical protein